MTKNIDELRNDYDTLYPTGQICIQDLFKYFSSDDLQGFLEHLQEEGAYSESNQKQYQFY